MVAISKEIFYASSSPAITCVEVFHRQYPSCFKAVLDFALQTCWGASRFFLVISLLQTLINCKKIDREFIKRQILAYLRSILYGGCYAVNFLGSICLARKLQDQFYFYNIAFSGACAGLAIFVESSDNRSLNTAIFINLVFETVFRYLYWSGAIRRSVFQETFVFMTCSAFLMYILSKRTSREKVINLWFYYPIPILTGSHKSADSCRHKLTCQKYFFNGFSNYFAVGYTLQLAKYIIPRLNLVMRSPKMLFQAVFSKDKFLFGLLLGSYVGIYRVVRCVLQKKDKVERPEHSAIAGFFAGFAYILKPTLPLMAIALTTALQVLIEQSDFFQTCSSILPVKELIFALCSGFLIHHRFFLPESCPKYVKSMLNTITNGKANELYQHALGFMKIDLPKAILSSSQ